MRSTCTILLAGGVGSRLSILVQLRAKPAVPFGGIYRIIDFTLSNIANSGLKKVAVLTQYKPLSLMDHIGDGSAWDLSGRTRSVSILPPKTGEQDWDWYKGTADAVRQNLDFITADNECKNVLILSGDHVYSMDYRPLVEFHRLRKAKVTIGMLEVPWEETHNFGTGIINDECRIIDWEEKPKKARSNLASMGIYVFDRNYLVRMLRKTMEKDFGHHIIPKAMREGAVFAYLFKGFWRDAGTIQAYWDSNMELLNPGTALTPEIWKTKTNITYKGHYFDRPPIRVASEGEVLQSAVSPGCIIEGRVEHSVLSPGVVVEKGAFVKDSVLLHDTMIKSGAYVNRCIIDKLVDVGKFSTVGVGNVHTANRNFPEQLFSGLTLIGKRANIPDNVRIGTNCIIYPAAEKDDFDNLLLPDGETLGKQ
jgi:glucose-1-phosphate adenylyltransferase